MCMTSPSESGHGGRFEPCEEYKRLQEEDTLAGIEARSVAVAIWRRRHSKEAPNWKPLDTTAGVVSQIDNMTAGLMNDLSALEAENAALRQELESSQQGHLDTIIERDALKQENQLLLAEVRRLRAALAPIICHADAPDTAPPLRLSVEDCRKIESEVSGR